MKCAIWIAAAAAMAASATEPKVKLPASRADLQQGQKLFSVHCTRCHGPKGEGGSGPALTRAKLAHAPDDTALVKVIEDGIRGTEMPGADAMSDHEMRQTAAYVRSLGRLPQQPPVPGNAANGGEIFRGKGHCDSCHAVHGQGGFSGPPLDGIGEVRSAAFLRESLVDPGKSVPDRFLLVAVTGKDGKSVTGVRLNEDSFSIQLRDDAGRMHSFWKQELAKIDRQKDKSPMPSFQGVLSEPELTDLVAYLASLKEAK